MAVVCPPGDSAKAGEKRAELGAELSSTGLRCQDGTHYSDENGSGPILACLNRCCLHAYSGKAGL